MIPKAVLTFGSDAPARLKMEKGEAGSSAALRPSAPSSLTFPRILSFRPIAWRFAESRTAVARTDGEASSHDLDCMHTPQRVWLLSDSDVFVTYALRLVTSEEAKCSLGRQRFGNFFLSLWLSVVYGIFTAELFEVPRGMKLAARILPSPGRSLACAGARDFRAALPRHA